MLAEKWMGMIINFKFRRNEMGLKQTIYIYIYSYKKIYIYIFFKLRTGKKRKINKIKSI